MSSYLRCTDENRPILAENWKLPPRAEYWTRKVEIYLSWKKITILSEKFSIPGSFDEKPSKMGKKWPKTGGALMN